MTLIIMVISIPSKRITLREVPYKLTLQNARHVALDKCEVSLFIMIIISLASFRLKVSEKD